MPDIYTPIDKTSNIEPTIVINEILFLFIIPPSKINYIQ